MSSKKDPIADYLSRLVKISTYAKREDVSVTEVHRRAKDGKIKKQVIDGVAFIELPASE